MSEEETPKRERLGELLIKANLIDDIQLRVALTAQKHTKERLGTTLVELGFIDEAVLAAFLSKQVDMPCINIANIRIPREIVQLIPKDVALQCAAMPIRRAGNILYLAMADPFDLETIDIVKKHIAPDVTITPMIAPEVSLKKCLERHYEPEKLEADEEMADLMHIADELDQESFRDLAEKVDLLSSRIDLLMSKVEAVQKLLSDKASK